MVKNWAANVGRDLKSLSGPTSHGKGSLNEIIQHPVQLYLENLHYHYA